MCTGVTAAPATALPLRRQVDSTGVEGLDPRFQECALPSLCQRRGRQDRELVTPIRSAEPADDLCTVIGPGKGWGREHEGQGNKRSEYREPWAEGWLTKCHYRGCARM
jgi:hypothetical protein